MSDVSSTMIIGITNNVIEPWLYGSRTGLSTLAIILAAVAVWQGSQYYEKIKLSHLQSDYLAAVGPAAQRWSDWGS